MSFPFIISVAVLLLTMPFRAFGGVWWVHLTHEGSNLSRPALRARASLSPEAIGRRDRLGIAIDGLDLPIPQWQISAIGERVKKIRVASRWLRAVSVEADIDQIALVEKLSFVARVTVLARGKRPVEPSEQPKVPPYVRPAQGGLDYGASFWQSDRIGITDLHAAGLSGAGVLIALLDAGFTDVDTHKAFSQLQIVATRDFVRGGSDVAVHGHGTSVLSVLGGYDPGSLIGPAFGAKFALARTEIAEVEIQVEEDHWIAGAEWADSLGADILNSSLSYTLWEMDSTATNYSLADLDGNTALITRAADIAVGKGMVVVISAGNDRGFNGTQGWEGRIGFPADGDSVITVGATTPTDSVAGFSSIGPTADGRIKPDLSAPGQNMIVAISGLNSDYTVGQGTSFSAPLISGLVALLLEQNPSWSPADIKRSLLWTAQDFGAQGPDIYYGHGIADGATAASLDLAGGLYGKVVYNGFPLSGVQVRVSLGLATVSATTDRRGQFVLAGLGVGIHSISFVSGGSEPVTFDAEVPQTTPFVVDLTGSLIAQQTFRFFPNPVPAGVHVVSLSGPVSPELEVSIHTLTGELVRRLSPGEVDWNLRNEVGRLVSSGIYVYRVSDGSGLTSLGKVAVLRN